MAPRANWKGFLKIAEVMCPVALYTAASSAERMTFHTINRATGHRVNRQFVDSQTGEAVERDDQVKGYELGPDDYVMLEPEEVAAAVPGSDKALSVEAFIACADIDDIYFDKPYYLTPADPHDQDNFALIRDGMAQKNVAALARAVLFRRVRTVLIRARGAGLVATTLNFAYEVRAASEVFDAIPALSIQPEMLDLAQHIITTHKGAFDPTQFDDRYEAALAELVKAKLAGKPLPAPKPVQTTNVVDLMQALRASAGASSPDQSKTKAKSAKKPAKKAG